MSDFSGDLLHTALHRFPATASQFSQTNSSLAWSEGMTFRYLGSKARLLTQISPFFGRPARQAFFVDPFCGTGAVAEAAAGAGWNVRINDSLHAAVIASSARLTSVRQAPFRRLGGYERATGILNALAPTSGFMAREYSPASVHTAGFERRYFTVQNAGRIDAIRNRIGEWLADGSINDVEGRLLIADLLGALNRVANIAGTFGCFLSKWTQQSQEQLVMRCRNLKPTSVKVEATVGDVLAVRTRSEDLVYLDPPYTKRQYASYYHILETVSLADEPAVEGTAGLRPWKAQASPFCYKKRALPALVAVVRQSAAHRMLISYSSEGHISIDQLLNGLAPFGRASIHTLGTIGRYRPNRVASSSAAEVHEYIIAFERRRPMGSKPDRPSLVAEFEPAGREG